MAELIGIEGEALTSGVVGEPNTFKVTMTGMNTAKLVVAFEGAPKPHLKIANMKGGDVLVTYTPQEEGEYTLNVTFDDDHVEGSPYKIQVKGK